jgi:transcriptional regulator with XRE-family HTH domain
MPTTDDNLLGTFLRDRRTKLDPAALGFSLTRRRTPGLRREEVALRANVSATWYTWLEQGRGGAPSADVLDRIGRALMLTQVEREHLFLLALGRPPEVRYRAADGVTPRLQRVLDSLEFSLGLVKTSTWDIVAWNRAAAKVFIDYASLAPEERNILRLLFCNRDVRAKMPNWESDVRFAVAAFRLETARAGASEAGKALVEELIRSSSEFAAMWLDNDVSTYGEGVKKLVHPIVGPLAFDYSAFAVDGRPDLGLVIYTPATPADAERVKLLVKSETSARARTSVKLIKRQALRPSDQAEPARRKVRQAGKRRS